jgi:hypothetical protein
MTTMTPRTHSSLALTEEQMRERIHQAMQEDATGQLVRCANEAEVREYFASEPSKSL